MLDAATTQVIRSYLLSAAQEMRRTLVRTAFNPVIYEVLDFGISLYDDDLELIADAPGLAEPDDLHLLGIIVEVEDLDAQRHAQADAELRVEEAQVDLRLDST